MALDFYKDIFKQARQYPLKIEDFYHAPICPGIYLLTEIFMGSEIIVYIGSSKSLRARFFSHPVIRKIKKHGVFGSAYVIPMRESDYKYEEVWFISKIVPKYNVNSTFKGKFKHIKN